MDHLAQATTDHNTQYVIKSTRRAGSTHGNYIATAKLKPPLNGHLLWPGEWRRAVISSGTRKLLLAGGLNVLYLIHSLAQPGEFGVHRFPGPI